MAGMHTIQTSITPLKLVPTIASEPAATPLSHLQLGEKGQDLKSAFDMFNEMSQQLTDSYFMLENRVAELNQELITVADQRMQELAEKEKLPTALRTYSIFYPVVWWCWIPLAAFQNVTLRLLIFWVSLYKVSFGAM